MEKHGKAHTKYEKVDIHYFFKPQMATAHDNPSEAPFTTFCFNWILIFLFQLKFAFLTILETKIYQSTLGLD